jgi:hypothetical protein
MTEGESKSSWCFNNIFGRLPSVATCGGKQELMEYGDLLTNFFECDEKGKDILEAVDDYSWEMLD